MSLLLIEGDHSMSDGLSRALRREGYGVDVVGTVRDAIAAIDGRAYRVLILDPDLPDADGGEVLRHMATRGLDTPVLALSARDRLEERVRLLDSGADDYLAKPAALDEILARVRALHRRCRTGPGFVLGRLSLDLDGKRAFVDHRPLELNGREWSLLSFLTRIPGRVVSKEELWAALYDDGSDLSINALDQIVSRFRKRLANTGVKLHTVRGAGYYLEVGDGNGVK